MNLVYPIILLATQTLAATITDPIVNQLIEFGYIPPKTLVTPQIKRFAIMKMELDASLPITGKFMEPWTNTLILLCKEGQEELVVEKMTARGNGLDVLSVDYVNVQNRAFKVWAKVFGYPTYTIDFTQPFDKQQEEIVEILDGFLMNSTRIL